MANLRQALEHVGDEEWLQHHSPLESLHTLGAGAERAADSHAHQLRALGIKSLDERLTVIWHDWEARQKTGLQALLWTAARGLKSDKDANHQALLLLTYFQDPRPRQGDLVKQLSVGQSTYYRQLGAAVEALERSVISQLQPSLRLESPAVRPLIGREELQSEVMAALRTGGVVSLIGASGLGKTSLGAALYHAWSAQQGSAHALAANPKSQIPNPKSFWYTFRPGLTDNLQHLVFSLALFLHQHGASDLWLQLVSQSPEANYDAARAMAVIRKSLEAFRAAPLLLCFDEVDLLLPGELEDQAEHQQVRAWLEDLAESSRAGAPLLFIGQRLLMQPERNHVFALQRFGLSETRTLLDQVAIEADDARCAAIQNYTRGNPLLLQLWVTLHRLGEPVLTDLTRLASAVSLDWFLARLRRHLAAREQDLLDAICVFDTPAPASLWRRQAKALDRLVQLNLIDRDGADQVSVPQALRDALYRQLPADLRIELHLQAAQACGAHGAYTLAAHHYMLGQQPEMAVWTWHNHRDAEVRQGQALTAWRIFELVRVSALAHEQDRRALALVLADLSHLHGRYADGLMALSETHWRQNGAATARAHELRGKLLAMQGDIDAALAEYRASLDDASRLSAARPISLRTEMARKQLVRARDAAAARREALLAKHDVEVLLGEIEDEGGDLNEARGHFLTALELARVSGDPARLAKANEVLGILEARRLNTDAAVRFLTEASQHYAAYGDVIYATTMRTSNIAFAYLMAGRHLEAIAPAEEAVTFFREMALPYELSLNEANLAEAHAHLGNVVQAEAHVWRAMAQEEAVVRPQCLYVLAHVRRLQGRLAEAERLARDAIDAAAENSDPWSTAYAQRVLAEAQRDAGADAREAFTRAHDAFMQLGLQPDADAMAAAIASL
jgi:tetratricopeptide (TPR) repeat protein